MLLVYIIYGFEVVRIQERKKALETFGNQKVRLIVEDNDKIFPRDGILKDFDDRKGRYLVARKAKYSNLL